MFASETPKSQLGVLIRAFRTQIGPTRPTLRPGPRACTSGAGEGVHCSDHRDKAQQGCTGGGIKKGRRRHNWNRKTASLVGLTRLRCGVSSNEQITASLRDRGDGRQPEFPRMGFEMRSRNEIAAVVHRLTSETHIAPRNPDMHLSGPLTRCPLVNAILSNF